MRVELRHLYLEDEGDPAAPVVIEADTAAALEQQLFHYLSLAEAATIVQFDGDFDFRHSQRFMRWLAARPVVDVEGDLDMSELQFGTGTFRGPGWDPPYGPRITIDPAVGTDTGHRIGIGRDAYALVTLADGDLLLFTPERSHVIVREYWDNNGWGDATRELAVREDGFLESSCLFMEGMSDRHRLWPPASTDEELSRAVVWFNRSNDDAFLEGVASVFDGRAFAQLLDRYLRADASNDLEDVGVYVEASYELTAQQRWHARQLLNLDE